MSNLILRASVLFCLAASASADDPFWAVSRPPMLGGAGTHREPTVAVGYNRILQAGNNWIACYERDGTLVWQARLHEEEDCDIAPYFWNTPETNPHPCNNPDPCANPCTGSNYTQGGIDSRVIFDQFSKRFILVRFHNGGSPTWPPPWNESHLYLAISKGFDEDPNDPVDIDAWDKYLIPTRTCAGGNCAYDAFDFPGLAVTEAAICVTARQHVAPGLGNSLHVFRRPPVGAPASFFANPANYTSINIPLGSGGPKPIGDIESLPMPAHVFGSVGTDTVYMAQVQEWKNPETNPPTGTIRVLAVTDPLGTPTLHTKRFSLAEEIRFNSRHLEEFCNPELVQLVKPSSRNIQNCAWRGGPRVFCHGRRSARSSGRFPARRDPVVRR